jgi:hypothetical protein
MFNLINRKKLKLFTLITLTFITFILVNYNPNNLTDQKAIAKTNFYSEIQQIIAQYNPQQPTRGDVRLLVISDLNSAYGSTEYNEEVHLAVKMIPFWQPDLILCSGDMVAGQSPSLTPQEIRAMWKAFDNYIAQPIRKQNVPFGFTIGNHDASGALGVDRKTFLFQQERNLAVEYWQNPTHNTGVNFVDRSQFPFYYTFEQQGIFYLVWDGSASHIPKDKLAWVEKSLSSKTAQDAKMRVVIGHLPLYAVSEGRDYPGEVLNNADDLRKLLEKYNVHTYISGHHHAYYPAHKGDLQLLHTGALGSGDRQLLNTDTPPQKTLTVIDINFQEKDLTKYTTYSLPNFQVINHQELPRFIQGHNGIVYRRDVLDR